MKGVEKRVVEIVEPEDENIERVIVFFKPESRIIGSAGQHRAAEKYVSGLVSWRRSILPACIPKKAWFWAAAVCGAAALLAFF